MAYHASALFELAQARARGQRPEIFVVVGRVEAQAWAERNRFFFVDERELAPGADLDPFAGLVVLIRTREPWAVRWLAQQLAVYAQLVILFDSHDRQCEYLRAA